MFCFQIVSCSPDSTTNSGNYKSRIFTNFNHSTTVTNKQNRHLKLVLNSLSKNSGKFGFIVSEFVIGFGEQDTYLFCFHQTSFLWIEGKNRFLIASCEQYCRKISGHYIQPGHVQGFTFKNKYLSLSNHLQFCKINRRENLLVWPLLGKGSVITIISESDECNLNNSAKRRCL